MSARSVHRIQSAADMERFGGRLAAHVEGGCVVFLTGDLGAGKTTLVRGLLRALGHEDVVPSPTFTLLETYDVDSVKVVHVDLYRLENATDLEQLAIRDYLGEQSILLVEWAERARHNLPDPDCELHIVIEENGHRIVRLEGLTEAGKGLCTA